MNSSAAPTPNFSLAPEDTHLLALLSRVGGQASLFELRKLLAPIATDALHERCVNLHNHGYLIWTDGHSGVSLTPSFDGQMVQSSDEQAQSGSTQDYLRSTLIEARRRICETDQLPAFRVFSDQILERLVQIHPLSLEELSATPGFGPFKAKKYASSLLPVLQALPRTESSLTPEN